MRLFFVLILLAIIIETVFLPYPFTLMLVIMSVIALGRNSLLPVFISGILLDLFAMRLWGLDSLIFLVVAALILRYNRKFQTGNPLYVFGFIFMAIGVYSLVFYRLLFSPSSLVMTLVLSVALLYLISITSSQIIGEKKKLTV
ncbi:MAG: hypothetical protein UV73_C0018G0011 [Candidatus Gottesmanbacteria bacterium GW2011_GWA2_43_14]|uniref:Rod shape-determining protein MreD n=1 Tax=Candidatus Gottesmanbacteria bacterium GW2011_GWA2_43_14 TaxID=1618443 RepID=A0A0G1G8V8_9BACT|nr:MAG: hypothetical protein UV73_C0018G0011 [Candidatus Gottesmanbacteria bacterium GW2011_GWA2_43_14]